MKASKLDKYIASVSIQNRLAAAGDLPGAVKPEPGFSQEAMVRALEAVRTANTLPRVQSRLEAEVSKGFVTLAGAPLSRAKSGLTSDLTYDDSQKAAIQTLLDWQYAALIGAAGTGKTTIVREVLSRLIYGYESQEGYGVRLLGGKQGPSIAIVTFTGVASGVTRGMLPDWCAPMCKTIHTLLEYAPVNESSNMFEPKRNDVDKLDHDVIFIDEAGQCGLNLMHKLLDACQPHTKIIMIGDVNQLVPVADTPYFPYVLANATGATPVWGIAELTKVHRQKGVGGNRIIKAAHEVLAGNVPSFDTVESGKAWHVIGIEIPHKTEKAHNQIVGTLNKFRNLRALMDPEDFDEALASQSIYQPYHDLLLTAGNGFEPDQKGSLVMQEPLNNSLARLLIPEEDNEVYTIDAGREVREFSVGDRVMCKKNESHGTENRVSNGTLGVIIGIEDNPAWSGDRMRFGSRGELLEEQTRRIDEMTGRYHAGVDTEFEMDEDAVRKTAAQIAATNTDTVDRHSSHIVTVRYQTGAVRVYRSATGVESVALAYAMTVHKAQGSQADTVFIVCHQACSFQLNREWLYTAITRAKKRVVIFYTDLGLRTAVAKQQIYGKTLHDKVERYRKLYDKGDKLVRLTA